eukprot:SM000095S24975  [mRNA]  locus=s95:214870:220471:+ [translate_table: standard]
MAFRGTLNDDMRGFYRSEYKVQGGQARNAAVTQFQAADARRCFPCWDEPSFKAKFQLTLRGVPAGRTVLSNMPADREEKEDGKRQTVVFRETPVMSTYLVACVIGELDYVEATAEGGVTVRVYAEPGMAEQGRFALEAAIKVLPFFAEWFGVPYPLPKLDMVAIADFSAGAMENYGLITYRSASLLVDPADSSAATKQRVAVTVAHEIAHQWFGNLVTMGWWTDLWLNEGFATWVWTQFATDELAVAFSADSLQESHPIEVEVKHPREIDEIFDDISYNKGAAIIQMLAGYLGQDAFKKGMRAYIKKYASQNAATADLWACLGAEAGEDIQSVMDTWTKQMGYPVLSASLVDGGQIQLTQERFLSLGVKGEGQWSIPLTYAWGSYDTTTSSLVQGKTVKIGGTAAQNGHATGNHAAAPKDSKSWVKLNVNQAGYYRVQYDGKLEQRLVEAVRSCDLSALDRFGLLDDTYALCHGGRQPLATLLKLLEAFREEDNFAILQTLCHVLVSVARVIRSALPDSAKDFESFAASMLQPQAKRLGWESKASEPLTDSLLRGELFESLVELGDDATIAEAKSRFEVFHEDRKSSVLPSDVRKAAYMAMAKDDTSDAKNNYDALLRIYRGSTQSEEQSRVLGAIGGSHDHAVVQEALNFALSPEVRSQDGVDVLAGIDSHAAEPLWQWVKEHWGDMGKRWGSDTFILGSVVKSSTNHFHSEEMAAEAEQFFRSNSRPGIGRTVRQCIEAVRTKAQWHKEVAAEAGLPELLQKLARSSSVVA